VHGSLSCSTPITETQLTLTITPSYWRLLEGSSALVLALDFGSLQGLMRKFLPLLSHLASRNERALLLRALSVDLLIIINDKFNKLTYSECSEQGTFVTW